MRLLYIYIDEHDPHIEDYGPFKNAQMNFTDRYTFEFDRLTNTLSCSKNETSVSDNFFSSKGVVQCISAIIGKNGSGKTSIANAMHTKEILGTFGCIIAYDFDGKVFVRNSLKNNKRTAESSNIKDGEIKLNSDISDIKITREVDNYHFLYTSNFFSVDHTMQTYCDSFFNLSTSYLMYEDYKKEKRFNEEEVKKEINNVRNSDNLNEVGEIDKVSSHRAMDYYRNISFFASYHTLEKKLPLSLHIPKSIRLRFLNNDIEQLKNETDTNKDFNSLLKEIFEIFERLEKAENSNNKVLVKFTKCFLANWIIELGKHKFEFKNKVILEEELRFFKFIDVPVDIHIIIHLEHFLDNLLTHLKIKEEFRNKALRIKLKNFRHLVRLIDDNNYQINHGFIQFNLNEETAKEFSYFYSLYDSCRSNSHFMSFEWWPVISSGEAAQLNIYSRIFSYLQEAKTENFKQRNLIIFMDEIEITIHPDLQRSLISNLIEFLECFFTDKYKIHLIFASHSPILLSDIPFSNTVFLRKKEDGSGCEVVPHEEIPSKTFAANIFNLYKHSFFTEGTIGTFAESKIQDLVKYFKRDENTPIKSDEEAQNLIDLIGEPVVATKLRSMLDEKNQNDIPSQIKILEQKLEKLRNDQNSNK